MHLIRILGLALAATIATAEAADEIPTICELLLAPTKVERRTQFVPGEFVIVKQFTKGGELTTLVRGDEQTGDEERAIKIYADRLPIIGRYLGEDDSGALLLKVALELDYKRYSHFTVRVPPEAIEHSNFGSVNQVNKALDVFDAIRLDFKIGEHVRYRDPSALQMREGIYLGPGRQSGEGNQTLMVQSADGSRIDALANEVYKSIGRGHVWSPIFSYPKRVTFDLNALGPLRKFMNQAARLSSHPVFLQNPPRAQIEQLTKFVHAFAPWHESMRYAEECAVTDFNDILTIGLSVCRHSAVLVAMVLSEAGFDARVVDYASKDESNGHAWVEVKVLGSTPGEPAERVYIADGSAKAGSDIGRIQHLGELEILQGLGLHQRAEKWYLQPAREYHSGLSPEVDAQIKHLFATHFRRPRKREAPPELF